MYMTMNQWILLSRSYNIKRAGAKTIVLSLLTRWSKREGEQVLQTNYRVAK
jgi:hypothetical protein